MPHSTSHSTASATHTHKRTASQIRAPSPQAPSQTEKFPDFDSGYGYGYGYGYGAPRTQSPAPRWQPNGVTNGNGGATQAPGHRRRDSKVRWAPREGGTGRKNSFAQTVHRMRSASMSQNAQEIAEAIRAPVSWKLVALCVLWYGSSALTNTSSKTILTAFDKPATLTIVQFAFVSSYCMLFSWLASTFPRLRAAVPALRHPIRYPSRDVIRTTLPLAAFQIGGHLLSSNATSKIPVSLVHTIKGLSPLFTVLAYRFFFDIRYPRATYLSLVPLTVGVMLACSGKHSFGGHFLGILYALLAAIIFVTQNIFSKRLFNEAAIAEQEGPNPQSRKLDKLNLLCYSSGLAFLLTCPIWFWSEGIGILGDFLYDGSVDLNQGPKALDHGPLMLEYIFNGTFHFGQNILAFILLSMVSPVTYSVASLIKRVFVIVIAIIWFRSPTTTIQAVGIALTFFGLYLYDRSNERNKADQRARSMTETRAAAPGASILPLNTKHLPGGGHAVGMSGGNGILAGQNGSARLYDSPASMSDSAGAAAAMAFASSSSVIGNYHPIVDSKKSDDVGGSITGGGGRNRGASNAGWRPPGTRQEDTWRAGDAQAAVVRS
ncbi:hypothetical protein VTJ49DRAFT_2086 [Mycothermus thermophilus]|uniref:Sugar phosphate transporter domain-containing protein n=1 Tax=Humicola insolens TaxID=85995 RepID=A0ABR3VAT3_HUMIN